MRAAPPVAVSLGDARRERLACALLAGAAAAALAAWLLDHHFDLLAPAWRWASVACAALLGLAMGGQLWPRASGELRWNGAQWLHRDLQGHEQPVAVRLMLDADAWLLLQCRPTGASWPVQWLGLWRSACGPAWHGLRAALYCPVPDAAAAAPLPPPDTPA